MRLNSARRRSSRTRVAEPATACKGDCHCGQGSRSLSLSLRASESVTEPVTDGKGDDYCWQGGRLSHDPDAHRTRSTLPACVTQMEQTSALDHEVFTPVYFLRRHFYGVSADSERFLERPSARPKSRLLRRRRKSESKSRLAESPRVSATRRRPLAPPPLGFLGTATNPCAGCGPQARRSAGAGLNPSQYEFAPAARASPRLAPRSRLTGAGGGKEAAGHAGAGRTRISVSFVGRSRRRERGGGTRGDAAPGCGRQETDAASDRGRRRSTREAEQGYRSAGSDRGRWPTAPERRALVMAAFFLDAAGTVRRAAYTAQCGNARRTARRRTLYSAVKYSVQRRPHHPSRRAARRGLTPRSGEPGTSSASSEASRAGGRRWAGWADADERSARGGKAAKADPPLSDGANGGGGGVAAVALIRSSLCRTGEESASSDAGQA